MKERRDKTNYYLDIAEAVSLRGTCLRRNYGAIIVKNDQIIATGYAGAPRGRKNCSDLGFCMREKLNIPRGERYELCRSVHAEQNAIISASREETIGSTIYLVGREANGEYIKNASPCSLCRRFIINAGIEKVVVRDDQNKFRILPVIDFIENDDSLSGNFGY
ncbi:MAG: cytidine deaminase [Clostridia bacterium]|nr:cytidine deaminase [Clostridia bacterium]